MQYHCLIFNPSTALSSVMIFHFSNLLKRRYSTQKNNLDDEKNSQNDILCMLIAQSSDFAQVIQRSFHQRKNLGNLFNSMLLEIKFDGKCAQTERKFRPICKNSNSTFKTDFDYFEYTHTQSKIVTRNWCGTECDQLIY